MIHGDEVVGVFDNVNDAIVEGYRRFGLVVATVWTQDATGGMDRRFHSEMFVVSKQQEQFDVVPFKGGSPPGADFSVSSDRKVITVKHGGERFAQLYFWKFTDS